MQRYSFKPEATTEDMRLSVALLIEEDPAGEWAKHEDAAYIIDDLIRQNVALDGELEQATARSDDYRQALSRVEHLVERYEAFYDKLMDADQEMVDKFRAAWPKGASFCPAGLAEDSLDGAGDGTEGGDTSECNPKTSSDSL